MIRNVDLDHVTAAQARTEIGEIDEFDRAESLLAVNEYHCSCNPLHYSTYRSHVSVIRLLPNAGLGRVVRDGLS